MASIDLSDVALDAPSDLEISHGRNSNIIAITDAVLGAGFDVMYEVDDLDRLIDADPFSTWGTIVSAAITSRTRRQQWTLDQVGNWNNVALDLNGDGVLTGTGVNSRPELTHHRASRTDPP